MTGVVRPSNRIPFHWNPELNLWNLWNFWNPLEPRAEATNSAQVVLAQSLSFGERGERGEDTVNPPV